MQAQCDGDTNQAITIESVGGGRSQVRFAHSNQCMVVQGASTAYEADLVQGPCGGAGSAWTVNTVSGGYQLVAAHSNLCADVWGAWHDVGVRLIQWGCSPGQGNQVFRYEAAPEPSPSIGAWSQPVQLPLVPVATSNLPDGRLLLWSAYRKDNFGGDRAMTQTAIYDPATGFITEREVSETGHDMFCPGVTNMPDGRVLVSGGSSNAETSIYDAVSNQWIDAPDMNLGRGYQSNVTLHDGRSLTFGGSWSGGVGNKFAEIFDGTSWQSLPGVQPENGFVTNDVQGVYRADNHMWLFSWGNRVFHAGPSSTMNWINLDGNGSTSSAGSRGSDPHAMNGNAVMFAPGKILSTGGGVNYSSGLGRRSTHVIDITGATVDVERVDDMHHTRLLHHSIVLPTGEVVVIGGQEESRLFTDDRAVLEAEIFDPETGSWTRAASMGIPRTYHSSAVLLRDGRIFAGGGGLCGSCAYNHFDAEIFTPPYLLNADGTPADRPTITSAPATATYGSTISVSATDAAEFVLMRLSNSTHSVNVEQRRVPLEIAASGGGSYALTTPANGGIAPPGVYMLFALDASGTPSVAEFVRLG